MSRPKVGGIGAIILVAMILTIVSVFTDGWIVVSVKAYGYKNSAGGGIVPYESGEPGWFAAASWMMFISLAIFFPLALIYLHAAWKVHHHGCCHSIRHSFHGIALASAIIALLEAIAFILMAANATHYASAYGVKASSSVGYSGYLALVSAVLMVVAMSLSGHVSRHDCH